jgi:multiple antibiotic resistance protein
MTLLELFGNYSLSFLVILNPLTTLVLLLSLLPESSETSHPRIAFKTALTVLIGSVGTLLVGDLALRVFHVDIQAFRAMGGLILVLLALHMVQAESSRTKHTESEAAEARQKSDISIIPLGIPITLGPGTITTIMIYRTGANMEHIVAMLLALILNTAVVYLVLRFAGSIAKLLGTTGINILIRLMGLVVGSIGVQFVVQGAKALWGS